MGHLQFFDKAAALAEKAAPYMHPKLSAVNLTVKPVSQMSDEELDAALASVSAIDSMADDNRVDGHNALVH
jgi:hypothetical protein